MGRLRCQRRDRAVQQDREQHGGDRGNREDRPPAGGVGDQPADRPRRQDAGEDPRHDDPDHAAAVGILGEVAGKRGQDLAGDGRQPEHRDREEQSTDRRCERAGHERGGRAEHHRRDKALPVQDVA
jgi:hypothetical protein